MNVLDRHRCVAVVMLVARIAPRPMLLHFTFTPPVRSTGRIKPNERLLFAHDAIV